MVWADPQLKGHIRHFEKATANWTAGRCILLCYVVSVHPGRGTDESAISHVCPCQHHIPVGQVGWKMRGRIDLQSVRRFMAISRQTTTTTVHSVLHSGMKYLGEQTTTPPLHLSLDNLHYSYSSFPQDIQWPESGVEPDTVALIFKSISHICIYLPTHRDYLYMVKTTRKRAGLKPENDCCADCWLLEPPVNPQCLYYYWRNP